MTVSLFAAFFTRLNNLEMCDCRSTTVDNDLNYLQQGIISLFYYYVLILIKKPIVSVNFVMYYKFYLKERYDF